MFDFFKDKFIFIADYDANIGNLSEKLFYTLHKAKRENKKVIFTRKRLLFKFLFNKIKYKQLKGIYSLKSPYLYKNSFIEILLGYYYGIKFSFHILYKTVLYVLKLEKPFNYKLLGKGFKDIINVEQKNEFFSSTADSIDWSDIYNQKLELDLEEEENKKCSSALNALGISKSDWFVCLHIRTSFFHKDPNSEYRNSTPENYRKMIEYIHAKGGKVIRLGDSVDMSINDICIDYPNTQYKSEIMDLYLIQNCKVYIGTNSGILDTAFLFGVPVLGINFSDFCLTKGFKSYDRILYKSIIDKKTKQTLTIENIFNSPMYINPNLNEYYLKKFFEQFDIEENTEDELLLAVKEMLKELEEPSLKGTLEKEYDQMVKSAVLRWIKEENSYFKENIEQAYRFYQRTYSNGRVCRFQLEQNLY